MCRKPTSFWCALAVVLSLVVLGAGHAAQAQQASGDVEAGDDANPDNVPPRRRGVVTEEADAPQAQDEVKPLPRLGASRRPDPVDSLDALLNRRRTPPSPAAALPGPDVIVCIAGCDGPSGKIYKK
jgi:hypothetical protein